MRVHTDADALFAPFIDGPVVWDLPNFAAKWTRMVSGNLFYLLLVVKAAQADEDTVRRAREAAVHW